MPIDDQTVAGLILGAVFWVVLFGAAGRFVLLKIPLTGGCLSSSPSARRQSPVPRFPECEGAGEALLAGQPTGSIRERSQVILPKVANGLGLLAMAAAIYLQR